MRIVLVIFFIFFLIVFIFDKFQSKHTVLRNFPVLGRLRYYLEHLGNYFRHYFYSGDREEMPFNRSTRAWVYRLAKNQNSSIGFGSTYSIQQKGSMVLNHACYPLNEADISTEVRLFAIGEGYCQTPFYPKSVFNISGMSFGSISKVAIRALSFGAYSSGCWINSGEGGMSPYHLEGGADLIVQIGTAQYGLRDIQGNLSTDQLLNIASHENVRAFEIKLSQGAKPGKGGMLPGVKVTREIAGIRGIPQGKDSLSPNRHLDVSNTLELLMKVRKLRDLTGKPIGIKSALGSTQLIEEIVELVLLKGLDWAPDFLAIDGAEGGSGSAPQAFMDHVGWSIQEALPKTIDILLAAGLKSRIAVIASGQLVTPVNVAWALCCGADFVVSGRGFLFALGCLQSLQCHKNTCPTGIATQNHRLQAGLIVSDKKVRVANYVRNMQKDLMDLSYACGISHPLEFRRHHMSIVRSHGHYLRLDEMYPYPSYMPNSKIIPIVSHEKLYSQL